MGSNKNQYKNNVFKGMQYAFWQTVVEVGGEYAEYEISAEFLQHSMEKDPSDLKITEGKVVKAIVEDQDFKNKINLILNDFGKKKIKFEFDSTKEDEKYKLRLSQNDLYYSLNNVDLYINANKVDTNWILDIKLHDKYDYSQPKTPKEHYKDTENVIKSMFSSILYNLASFSVKIGVLKEYYIDIQFKINQNFEVIK